MARHPPYVGARARLTFQRGGLGISWRSGRIQDATNLTTLLCGKIIFFRKSWECYRDFSDSEEEDAGFSPMVGQFIDENNNDEVTGGGGVQTVAGL